jgi:polyisoprenoid-binding protein YceI
MKKLKLLIATVLLAIISNAQVTTWGFDKSHSNVRFAVSHMVISEVEGNFSIFEGSVVSSKADFSDAEITFTIDVSSIDTDSESRDEHLLNEDFFDVAKYPTIDFRSKSMKNVGENKFELTGDLTMHGVTKEIILGAKYGGTIKDPWGNTKAGFKVTGTIDRTLWDLNYNSTMDSGGLVIGVEIDIVCNLELKKL